MVTAQKHVNAYFIKTPFCSKASVDGKDMLCYMSSSRLCKWSTTLCAEKSK